MEEFKGNSYAQKRENEPLNEKSIKPVTSNVQVKKPNELNKFGKRLFTEDAKSVGGHVVDSVLIPSIQKLISDIVKNAIDWLIYGVRGVSQSSSGVRNVSYSSYYDRKTPTPAPQPTNKPSVYMVNEVIFNERGDAEETLLRLKELVDRYGMASVGEFYELIDQRCDFTANKYGWRDLKDAYVTRKNNGYSIVFPKITTLE